MEKKSITYCSCSSSRLSPNENSSSVGSVATGGGGVEGLVVVSDGSMWSGVSSVAVTSLTVSTGGVRGGGGGDCFGVEIFEVVA